MITAPASNQGTIRERSSPPTVDGRRAGRAASGPRATSAGAGDEVLVAADARVLAAVDRVGDHLAVDVDRQRAVDRDHRAGCAPITSGEFTMSTGQEGDLVVAVEPLVELARCRRRTSRPRRRRRLALAVGDLARLVQLHEAGREHLRVDAVVAAVALGEQRGDRRRDRADAGLQRGAVGDERRARARRSRGRRRSGGGSASASGVAVALDQHVDLVDVERVAVLAAAARTCAGSRADLDDRAAGPGSAPARCSSLDGGAGVQREAAPAVGVGRARRRSPSRAALAPRAAGAKRRKSAGAKPMLAPVSRSSALERARRSPTGSGRSGG